MTVTSKIGGISQNRRTGEVSLFLRENGIYVANLTAGLRGFPKHVVGALAATALVQSILATKADSGRAAANWDLAVSGKLPVRNSLDPHDYGQEGPSYRKIGRRGHAGRGWEDQVMRYKKMYYGIGQATGSVYQAMPGGLLYEKLGIGQAGSPRVDLFNPIAGTLHQRRDGGSSHSGNTYPYYAFRGANPLSNMPWAAGIEQQIGNALVPKLILSLTRLTKERHAKGAIQKL